VTPAPPAPRPLRVLVVDDHRDSADSLGLFLTLLGHDARVVYGGAGARAVAASFPPDVVLMDIEMPGEDGYAVARALCGQLGYRPVRVAVTCFGNLEERSRSEGFEHHLLKPLDPAGLVPLLAGCAPSDGGG
jgi:CheY-like chemotaxis protein